MGNRSRIVSTCVLASTLAIALASPLAAHAAPEAGNPTVKPGGDIVDSTKKLLFFQDTVRSVVESGEKIKVTFLKHAAIYGIERKGAFEELVRAAKESASAKKPVHVTVNSDSKVIQRLDSNPDPARPKGGEGK